MGKRVNVKVLERFFDKYTGAEYKKGDVLNVADSRFKEMKKFVEVVKESKKEEK